jgi:thymidylate synthase (FAD)
MVDSVVRFVENSTVRLHKTNASDEDVAFAAWVSTYDDPEARDTSDLSKLINFLYSNRHMSPFEHGSFTFFVECPIFVAREFHRHRTWSYNEASGRYKTMEPLFYMPSEKRPLTQVGRPGQYTFTAGTVEQNLLLEELITESTVVAWSNYQRLKAAGIANEIARDVLPLNLMTRFYATANPRNVMQFLQLRNDPAALYEIRDVAVQIERLFAEAMPLTYAAYKQFDWREDKKKITLLEAEIKRLSKHEQR